MYLDSAYIAKYYVNEPDAAAVRALIKGAPNVCSSAWAVVEVTSVFHRHVRSRYLTASQAQKLADVFTSHIEAELWHLIAVSDFLIRRASTIIHGLPDDVPLRAGDAIHLASALHAGETELYTNDRHLLAAARYVGLRAKSVAD